jgi:hypothetical protein
LLVAGGVTVTEVLGDAWVVLDVGGTFIPLIDSGLGAILSEFIIISFHFFYKPRYQEKLILKHGKIIVFCKCVSLVSWLNFNSTP